MDHLRARLITLALATLAPVFAFGAACPVYPTGPDSGEMLPSWPTGKTVTGAGMSSGSGCVTAYGGQTSGAANPPGGTNTVAGVLNFAYNNIVADYLPTYNAVISVVGPITNTSTDVNYCIRIDLTQVSNGATLLRWKGLQTTVTSTPCDPPAGDDEVCGGSDMSVGEGYDESQAGEEMWTYQTIVAPTWNDAAGYVPECMPMSGSTTNCTVTGIYKTGPGLNKNEAGSFEWVANIRFGGGACDTADSLPSGAEEPDTPLPDNTQGENCNTSDAGVEYCHENAPENEDTGCGWYEDEYVCLDRAEDDECWIGESGARFCGENAPMPPVPDNGTAGVPAEPDDTIQDPDTDNEYEYYDPDTVDGSSRPAGDNGANPNRPGSTNPSTPTQPTADQGGGGGGPGGEGFDPQGDDSAGGGGTCNDPPTCDGDPIQCAILTQQWKTRCVDMDEVTGEELEGLMGFTEEELTGEGGEGNEVEIDQLDADGIWSSATCPAPTNISVMGHSIEIDVWQYGCMAAEFFAPFVLAMGYLLAGLLIAKGIT